MIRITAAPKHGGSCTKSSPLEFQAIRLLTEEQGWSGLKDVPSGAHQFWLVPVRGEGEKYLLLFLFKWHDSVLRYIIPQSRVILSGTDTALVEKKALQYMKSLLEVTVPQLNKYFTSIQERGRLSDVVSTFYTSLPPSVSSAQSSRTTPVHEEDDEPMPETGRLAGASAYSYNDVMASPSTKYAPSSSVPPSPVRHHRVAELQEHLPGSTSPSFKVPPLKLPSTADSPYKQTRSSRRYNTPQTPIKTPSEPSPSTAAVDAKASLLTLAARLGQSCAIANVPALLSRKRDRSALGLDLPDFKKADHTTIRPASQFSIRALTQTPGFSSLDTTRRESKTERAAAELVAFQRISHKYNVALAATSVMRDANKASIAQERPTVRVPVNAVYMEMLSALRHPLLRNDTLYLNTLCRSLQAHSVSVERELRSIALSPASDRPRHAGRKCDLVIWRVQQRLFAALEHLNTNTLSTLHHAPPLEEASVQLEVLALYMRECRTSVMAAHAMDVCAESLLAFQALLIMLYRSGRFATINIHRLVRATTALLNVFDEVIEQCQEPHLLDLLVSALVMLPDSLSWLEAQTHTALFSKRFEADIQANASAEEHVSHLAAEHRLCLVQHHRACFQLLRRYGESGSGQLAAAIEQMKRFAFLLRPDTGLLPTLLRLGVPQALQEQALMLFETAFSWKHCPFIIGLPIDDEREYVDAYVHTHYTVMTKLICGNQRDPVSVKQCALHARVLLAFAQHRIPSVIAMFQQLRVMEMLARTILLESDMNEVRSEARIKAEAAKRAAEPSVVVPVVAEHVPVVSTPPVAVSGKPPLATPRKKSDSPAPSPTVKPKQSPSPGPSPRRDLPPVAPVVEDHRPVKFSLPPLKLPAYVTYDGKAVEGKAIKIFDSADTVSTPPVVALPDELPTSAKKTSGDSSSDVTPVHKPAPAPDRPQSVKMTLPPLKLSGTVTFDGQAKEGKPIVILNSESSTDVPPVNALPADLSNPIASVETVTPEPVVEEAKPAPIQRPASVKFFMPPLKLTAAVTYDGQAKEGKPIPVFDAESSVSSPPVVELPHDADAPGFEKPVESDIVKDSPVKKTSPVLAAIVRSSPPLAPVENDAVPADLLPSQVQQKPDRPQSIKFMLPPLKLTAAVTFDGQAKEGKSIAIYGDESAPVVPSSSVIPNAITPAPQGPAPVKSFLPPLRLPASATFDGQVKEGKSIEVFMSAPIDASTVVKAVPSVPVITTLPEGVKLRLPALRLDELTTKDGSVIQGKEILILESVTPASPVKSLTSHTSVSSPKSPVPPLAMNRVPSRAEPSRNEKPPSDRGPMGGLTQAEKTVDASNPKMHLAIATMKRALEMAKAPARKKFVLKEGEDCEVIYHAERQRSLIYQDPDLHVTILHLIISLMLTPRGTLQPVYADSEPGLNHRLNVLFLLTLHLNEPLNDECIPVLTDRVNSSGDPAAVRLLRLLCKKLFDTQTYQLGDMLGKGAFGQVFEVSLQHAPRTAAAKLTTISKQIWDRQVLVDLFTEVTALEMFATDRRFCHLYDYGTDGEKYWLVMKRYKTSLKDWRLKQTAPLSQMLPVYMQIYAQVLEAIAQLADNNIVHFDIKAENILLEPIDENISESEFWNPSNPDQLPFNICVADFGECDIFPPPKSDEEQPVTCRNRGTEPIKSPEMLTIAWLSKTSERDFDRRKRQGAGAPSDVWSLGCLLYEILTGKYLFNDEVDDDFGAFMIRLTGQDEELIPDYRRANIEDNKSLLELLHYILVRDAQLRPTVHDVIRRASITIGETGGNTRPTPRHSSHHTPRQTPRSIQGTPRMNAGIVTSGGVVSGMQVPSLALPSFESFGPRGSVCFDNLEAKSTLAQLLPQWISFVTPHIAVAAEQVARDRELLLQFGITHIVNATGKPNLFKHDFTYFSVSPLKTESLNANNLHLMLSFVRPALERNAKILIVSDHGVSRGPALACACLMDTLSLSYYRAMMLVRSRRFITAVHPYYAAQLVQWEESKRPVLMGGSKRGSIRSVA